MRRRSASTLKRSGSPRRCGQAGGEDIDAACGQLAAKDLRAVPPSRSLPESLKAEPAERLDPRAKTLWRISGALGELPLLAGGALASWVLLRVAGVSILLAILPFLARLALFVSLASVVPDLRWRRWRYEIRDDEVDLQRGVLWVTRTLVPLARIQHVDTQSGPCSAGSVWLRSSSTQPPGRTRSPSSPRPSRPRRGTGSPSSRGSRMSSEPRHLHPAAMLIAAIKTIRRSLSAFVIPGVAFLMSRGFDAGTIALVLLAALVVAVFAAFWGFLSWRATTYEVAGGAFRLRQGVVQKNERTIPLDHVQSVDTVQGIIQRLFNVVEVRIETAGGGASEPDASLAALARADAEALRREIEGSRREPAETEEVAGPASSGDSRRGTSF